MDIEKGQALLQHTCKNCDTTFVDGDFCPECGEWPDESGSEEFALDNEPETRTISFATITCSSCGTDNPSTNRHCEECGARLHQGALPVAPQPMIKTSAGVRAVAIIGTVIILVTLGSVIFNRIFVGDGSAATDATLTSSETTQVIAQAPLVAVPVIDWECSSELGAQFACANLFDGDPETSWNDDSSRGEGATITATFDGAYSLESIILTNLAEDARFERNYRIQGVDIVSDNSPIAAPAIIPDSMGPQVINYLTLRTTTITISVTTIYASAESEGEPAFDELALQEIEFFGRAVTP